MAINVKKFKEVAKVVLVPLHLIDNAAYNPSHRSDPKEVQSLADSIRDHGQLVPVHLFLNAKKTRLMTNEGHRRVAACRLNGDEFVEAIIKDHAPPAEYAQINEEVSKHSQADKLQSYLRKAESVGPWFQKRFATMVNTIGCDTAEKMVKYRKGLTLFNRANKQADWIGLPQSQRRKFINYQLDVADAETNCRKLRECIDLRGEHTEEARMLEIRQAFDQRRTPSLSFRGNRFEVNHRVAVN